MVSKKALTASVGGASSAGAVTTAVVLTEKSKDLSIEEGKENEDDLDLEDALNKQPPSGILNTEYNDGTKKDKGEDFGNGGICSKNLLSSKLDLATLEANSTGKYTFDGKDSANSDGCLFVTGKKKSNNNRGKGILKIEALLKNKTDALLLHGALRSKNSNIDVAGTGYALKKESKKGNIKFNKKEKKENITENVPMQTSNTIGGFEQASPGNGCDLSDESDNCKSGQGEDNSAPKNFVKLGKANNEHQNKVAFKSGSNNFSDGGGKYFNNVFELNGALEGKGIGTDEATTLTTKNA